MQGSLRLHAGVLFVGRQALTAEVSSHDLDGRPLETRFSFRDSDAGRSSVDGLDVDADRRLWIADGASGKVRCFTLFGVEVASVGDESPGVDARGALGQPVDVRVIGTDEDMLLLVASGGDRRHALQVLVPSGGKGRSIAPMGDPEGRFRRIRGLDWRDGELAVVEAGARRVQVFEGSLAGRLQEAVPTMPPQPGAADFALRLNCGSSLFLDGQPTFFDALLDQAEACLDQAAGGTYVQHGA